MVCLTDERRFSLICSRDSHHRESLLYYKQDWTCAEPEFRCYDWSCGVVIYVIVLLCYVTVYMLYSVYIYVYIFYNINYLHIHIYVYEILKAVCFHVYHQNGFVLTYALRHMALNIYIYDVWVSTWKALCINCVCVCVYIYIYIYICSRDDQG